MNNIVIFGGPGSGKGTQSARIANRYHLYHISTGEVLRDHIARGTEIGKTADKYISKGQLIPDELMLEVLSDLLRSKPEETRNGVIFDGFPRTLEQAKSLDKMLAKHGQKVGTVLGLEVNDDELVRRMLKRGEMTGRADDNIDTIKKRLTVYHNQTAPLKDYYTADGRYRRIDGATDETGVFNQIADQIDHLNTPPNT